VSQAAAQFIVSLVGVYAAAGLLFAVCFVWRLVARLDAAATGGSIGFRILIVPGVVAFWPYLAARLVAGASAPPDEWTAHRVRARGPGEGLGRAR
jgi:hypothetical protein